MLRLILLSCLVLLFSAAAFAQVNDYTVQLQSLEQETQLQMRALEEQHAVADAQDAEAIEARVADLKFQYEIRRLNILLQQAEAQGDEARAAEIRHALDNWLNPPAPQVTAPIQRSAPGTRDVPPEVRESTR
jgi:hypothetical protein